MDGWIDDDGDGDDDDDDDLVWEGAADQSRENRGRARLSIIFSCSWGGAGKKFQ